MMIGERNHHHSTPWNFSDNPTADISLCLSPNGNANFNGDDYSFFLHNDTLTALRRYLPSNDAVDYDDGSDEELELPVDAYSCDHFRMYEFKVRKCARARSHDWTECPFAHPGEKARRRDPRKFHYSGTPCPDFRKGHCKRGDGCEYAHGVFECWLHPARYRTQPCKDGQSCSRRVCFFAHTAEELRVLSPRTPFSADSYDGSPRRLCFEWSSSPTESPPMSPMTKSLSRSLGSSSVSEMLASFRQLQLNKLNSWALQVGSSGLGSPGSLVTRSGFSSLPSTPTRVTRPKSGYMELWEKIRLEEEPVLERVESGRDLRVKMLEKLSKENPLDRVSPTPYDVLNPDVGWVSELLN